MQYNNTIGASENQEPKKTKRQGEIKVKKREGFTPPLDAIVRHTVAGDFITIRYMRNKVLGHIKRLDKTHYKVLTTGEVKEYMTMDSKAKERSKRCALNRTFDELRAIIRANFAAESESQLFITLTYRENMQDEKRLMKDFEEFFKRLDYHYGISSPKWKMKKYKDDPRRRYNFEYVAVMEPQGRGAWHVHLLLKATNEPVLWLPKEDISRLWGHGMTTTARLISDDVGNYYTAYFTGLIAGTRLSDAEQEGCEPETGEDILDAEQGLTAADLSKAYIKGARLAFYPPRFRFYRCSRGIIRPAKYDDYLYDIENNADYKKVYENTYEIERQYDETTEDFEAGEIESLNTIHKATYRRSSLYNPDNMNLLTDDNIVIQAKRELMRELVDQLSEQCSGVLSEQRSNMLEVNYQLRMEDMRCLKTRKC